MDFEKINITEIVPAEYNPRRISEEEFLKLQNSIESFGLVDPIIINLKNNHIIGGHQRYDVLLEEYVGSGEYEQLNIIRLGDIGWCFSDEDMNVESEKTEKMLNIALNKISGQWDEPKLQRVLEDIAFDFNINSIGFGDLADITLDKINDEYKTDTNSERLIEVKDNAVFRFDKYTFLVPYEKYMDWDTRLLSEAEQLQIPIEELLGDKLGLNQYLNNNENDDDEVEDGI